MHRSIPRGTRAWVSDVRRQVVSLPTLVRYRAGARDLALAVLVCCLLLVASAVGTDLAYNAIQSLGQHESSAAAKVVSQNPGLISSDVGAPAGVFPPAPGATGDNQGPTINLTGTLGAAPDTYGTSYGDPVNAPFISGLVYRPSTGPMGGRVALTVSVFADKYYQPRVDWVALTPRTSPATWDEQQARGFLQALLPGDSEYLGNEQIADGVKWTYFSHTLAVVFAPTLFRDSHGNSVTPGTFAARCAQQPGSATSFSECILSLGS